jgi:hypothetical protein
MKTIIATAIFALGLALAPAHASTQMSKPEANTPKQSLKTAQANCSFTYRRECNGYCWVCY